MYRTSRIDKAQVEHVAKLARIKLDPDDAEIFTEQFQQILDYFAAIEEVETDDVEPAGHQAVEPVTLREDKPRESLPQDQVLQNAPRVKDGYIKSPKIM